MKERHLVRVAVYVIFEKDDSVLLSLRQNTGYKDGMYGVVQGHFEAGEGIYEAAIREVYEEAGVEVSPDDLELKIVGHNRVDMEYIDFVFSCRNWCGELRNNESDSCADLSWFERDKLPSEVMPLISKYIKLSKTAGVQLVEVEG